EAVNQEEGDRVERAITTNASLEAAQDIPGAKKPWEVLLLRLEENVKLMDTVPTPYDSPLPGGYTLEVMRTKLPKKIKKKEMIQLSLDEELAQKLYVEELEKEAARQIRKDIAIDVIPLDTKPLVIIEYKIVKERKICTYLIVRADGSTKRYTSMINLLENIDREDLETLWKLVEDKHENTRPEDGYERVL
nr:hypothetical protein [Tanacetum cinerariifolium]